MKHILLIVLCLTFSTIWATEKKDKKEKGIAYCTTLEEALQQAQRVHKPIFFNCYADWAHPSVVMDSIILKDPDLVSFIEKHFVSLRVDMPNTPEGRQLTRQYNVTYYAHYLILDENGKLLHRITGGAEAPEFKKLLEQGLNPKTSLSGMTQRYEQGERSSKFLAAYAEVLNTASEDEKYQEVANYYLQHADSSDLYLPATWKILTKQGREYNSQWFNFIYDHRDELEKKNGEQVSEFIIQVAFLPVYSYMVMDKVYNAPLITEIEERIGQLNTTSASQGQLLDMCRILHLRQQKKYTEMLDIWEKTIPALPNELLICRYDATLGRLQEMSEAEKARAVGYLNGRMTGQEGSTLAQYRQTVEELTHYQGIRFETGSLPEALAKARKENKAVFVDCYTTWCIPAK